MRVMAMTVSRRLLCVVAACMLLSVALCGCARVSRYERGPMVAFGEPVDGASEPRYYSVGIDLRRPSDPRVMRALVKLGSQAPPMALGELRPEPVSRYLPPFSPPPQWPQHLRERAKEFDAYEGGGIYVSFKDGALVFVGICSHCAGERHSPVVGTPDGGHFYPLPLTERQVEDVFGSAGKKLRVREVMYGP